VSIKPPLDLASASKALKNSKRILILGAPGAGKSTLACHLFKNLKKPIISLDQYYWQNNWKPISHEAFLSICVDLVKKDQWIMEGNFGMTFDVRWSRADMVIFLDPSPWLCFLRQLKRFLFPKSAPLRPTHCKERVNLQLFWLTMKFRKGHGILIEKKMREKFPDTPFLRIEKIKQLTF
jgi:adenylate kinase family enzyme